MSQDAKTIAYQYANPEATRRQYNPSHGTAYITQKIGIVGLILLFAVIVWWAPNTDEANRIEIVSRCVS